MRPNVRIFYLSRHRYEASHTPFETQCKPSHKSIRGEAGTQANTKSVSVSQGISTGKLWAMDRISLHKQFSLEVADWQY